MTTGRAKAMVVAGVMSGTSADGVDVAICQVRPGAQEGASPRVKVLAHRGYPYTAEVRGAVLAAMNARETSTAELARLSWRLGEVYADAVQETVQRTGFEPQLVAVHGQTIFHEATAAEYLGEPVRSTWQTGEPAVIAERLRLPVVSDFRTADLAAGGQGAPLVPMLDFCMFRHKTKNRILLNLGGIANMTVLPAGCDADGVLAFDSGPANMVIDAAMERLTGRRYDCGGGVAGRGEVLEPVLAELMKEAYLRQAPPKSCGREQFGAEFVERFLAMCGIAHKREVIATATAFTADSILDAYRRFVWPHLGQRAPLAKATELFVSGGGAHNVTLMKRLRAGLEPLYVSVQSTEDAGLGVEAKEAAAFALLGWLTWHGLPGNVPAATGASRPVVLGRITPA
jgi:anhydro-N-acetylmuramic acid kinase